MARIIYKEGLEGQNTLESIEGIEIDLLNGQKALIYPKYAELPLLDYEQVEDWKAKSMTEIEALKVEDSAEETDELLTLGSPAAEFVRKFKTDLCWRFNLPTLLAAMELQDQKNDIDELAGAIEGTDRLSNFTSIVWSCSRKSRISGWLASGNAGCSLDDCLRYSYLAVPAILY
nr:MAG TPA: hypothetical protein [Caudoviricetes sp.]